MDGVGSGLGLSFIPLNNETVASSKNVDLTLPKLNTADRSSSRQQIIQDELTNINSPRFAQDDN